MNTLKEIIDRVFSLQNSSDLIKITEAFFETMVALEEIEVDEITKKDIAILYSFKIASITGSEKTNVMSLAYIALNKIKQSLDAQ